MKSGTTYLSVLLGMHPEIFMSSPREPCHFADPNMLRRTWPLMWERGYWRSTERYLSLFAEADGAKIIAEGSTVYSQAPLFAGVPERILEFNPDAKFIYIIRDPVERTISHYWHNVRWWGERRQLLRALRENDRYLQASYYAYQLRAYLRRVGRERVYVLTFEQLISDPDLHLRALYRWLGVEPTFQPRLDVAPINPTPESVEQVRGFGVLNGMRKSALYTRLEPWIAPALRKLAHRLAVRDVRTADAPLAEAERYLRPIQLGQTAELSELLGTNFPEWATLFASEARPADTSPGPRLPDRERIAAGKAQRSDCERRVAHDKVCRESRESA
jgi:hypothetical protein